MALPASDSFVGAAGVIPDPPWTQQNFGTAGVNVNRDGSGGAVVSSGGEEAAAFWNADTFNNDQESEITIGGAANLNTGGAAVGATARASGTTSTTFDHYVVRTNGVNGAGNSFIGKRVNGTLTELLALTVGTIVDGDRLKIRVEGINITAFLNGVQIGTTTDSSLTSGQAGLFTSSSTSAGATITDWTANNFSAAPIEQEGARFRNDDGSESAATWLAAQDANVTQPVSTNTRLRVLLNATGDPASFQGRLDYKKSTDSVYIPVRVAQPALVRTEKTAGASTSNVATFATASIAMLAGRTYLIGFVHSDTAPENAATSVQSTGGAVVFSSIASVVFDTIASNVHRLELWKATPTADVTDTITINLGDAGTGCAWIVQEYADCDSLGTPVTNNANAATSIAATPGALAAATSHQIAFGANDLNVTTDTASGTNWSSVGTGQTYATPATGLECAENTSGTAQQVTFSGAGAADRGVIVVEVKQLAAQPIIMAASANIAASGAPTTAQLAAPSGKSTTDFVAGRIQDDENPADAVDITVDDYSEFEWCLTAVSGLAVNGDVYQFRVTKNGVALDTYTVTPQWTIGTAGPAVSGSGLAKTSSRVIASGVKSASGAGIVSGASRTVSTAQKGALSFGTASSSSRALATGASTPPTAGSGIVRGASRVIAQGSKAATSTAAIAVSSRAIAAASKNAIASGVVRTAAQSSSAGTKGAIGSAIVRDTTFLLSAGVKATSGAGVASCSERVIVFGSSVAIIQGSGIGRSSSRVTAAGAKAAAGFAAARTSSRALSTGQKAAISSAMVSSSSRTLATAGPTARSNRAIISTSSRALASASKSTSGAGKVSSASRVMVASRLDIITFAIAKNTGTFSLADAKAETVSLDPAHDNTTSLNPTE